MDWYDEEEVMRACAVGEMAQILIKAMGWESKYNSYKKTMFDYLSNSAPLRSTKTNSD